MARSKVALRPAFARHLLGAELSSTTAGANDTIRKPRVTERTVGSKVQQQQLELLREVHALLTDYAPSWYTEELDARLTQAVAGLPSTKIHTNQPRSTPKHR